MKRTYTTDENEPTESQFKIPSEGEKLFQVTDINPAVTPSGEDDNIQVVKLEIVGGDDNGLSILNRVNLNQDEKAFYFARLFLKAIGEPYKGEIELDTDHWCGRQFYATVKHTKSKDGTKTYANIGEYNFDKKIEQVFQAKNPGNVKSPEEIAWEE
jgi:hypothetical protein